eukprot:EG_transcript_7785
MRPSGFRVLLFCAYFVVPVWQQCPISPNSDRRSALILATGQSGHGLNDSTALLGGLLRDLGLDVDVAHCDDAAIEAVCRAHNLTAVSLFAAPTSHGLNIASAKKRHTFRYYSVFVWLTDDLVGALPHLQTLRAASSLLWAHGVGIPWPSSRFPDFQQLLKFDYVWFDSSSALRATSWLVNPMGHQPLSFRLVPSSAPPAPSTVQFVQTAIRQLLREVVNTTARPGTVTHPSPAASLSRRRRNMTGTKRENLTDGQRRDIKIRRNLRSSCPGRRSWARIALAVHLASHPTTYLRSVFAALRVLRPIPAHLWLTYFHAARRRAILRALRPENVTAHVLGVRNKGLDIGPFFAVLWQIMHCKYRYDYILKFHFKSNEADHMARQAAMIFHISTFLLTAVTTLDNRTSWAAIYPHIPDDRQLVVFKGSEFFLGINSDAMSELSETLALPWSNKIIVGTVFLGRLKAFTTWFRNSDVVWRFYMQLTDIDGLEWRWYNMFYFNFRCDRAAVEWHYLHFGGTHGFHGNVYAMPDYRRHPRDGMVEHAWERILSFMLSTHGTLEPIPVPYMCHPAYLCPAIRPD